MIIAGREGLPLPFALSYGVFITHVWPDIKQTIQNVIRSFTVWHAIAFTS